MSIAFFTVALFYGSLITSPEIHRRLVGRDFVKLLIITGNSDFISYILSYILFIFEN